MAFLLQKFQEAIRALAKNPRFARDPRHLQFEADVNRLFLYTSYSRLGRNADEKDVNEIIEMATKASVIDQQKQVQENIHFQIKNMCVSLDDILHLDSKSTPNASSFVPQLENAPRRSGLSFAIGSTLSSTNQSAVPETRSLTHSELSQSLKERIGYTLEIKPSQISHKDAGQGLFLTGEADIGSVVAFYPGVIYSPAFYKYIPGYPKVDARNSKLITRYDGFIINAQPWGSGGETRDLWDGSHQTEDGSSPSTDPVKGHDKLWRFLAKPAEKNPSMNSAEVLELRNPLAFGHFANHPVKGTVPNVMVCPYDFPTDDKGMRTYVPNVVFGGQESVKMKRFGSFWFKMGGSGGGQEGGSVIQRRSRLGMFPLTRKRIGGGGVEDHTDIIFMAFVVNFNGFFLLLLRSFRLNYESFANFGY